MPPITFPAPQPPSVTQLKHLALVGRVRVFSHSSWPTSTALVLGLEEGGRK